jgi:hypothetical protein
VKFITSGSNAGCIILTKRAAAGRRAGVLFIIACKFSIHFQLWHERVRVVRLSQVPM